MIQCLQKIYSPCFKWKHFLWTEMEESMSRMFYSGITNRQKILSKNQQFVRGLSKHIYLIIVPNDAAQFHRHSFNCFLCCQITSINCSTVVFKIFFSFFNEAKARSVLYCQKINPLFTYTFFNNKVFSPVMKYPVIF